MGWYCKCVWMVLIRSCCSKRSLCISTCSTLLHKPDKCFQAWGNYARKSHKPIEESKAMRSNARKSCNAFISIGKPIEHYECLIISKFTSPRSYGEGLRIVIHFNLKLRPKKRVSPNIFETPMITAKNSNRPNNIPTICPQRRGVGKSVPMTPTINQSFRVY